MATTDTLVPPTPLPPTHAATISTADPSSSSSSAMLIDPASSAGSGLAAMGQEAISEDIPSTSTTSNSDKQATSASASSASSSSSSDPSHLQPPPSSKPPRSMAFPTSLSDFRLPLSTHHHHAGTGSSASSSTSSSSSYAFPTTPAMSASDSTPFAAAEGTTPPTSSTAAAFRRGTPSVSSVMVGRLRRSSMLGRELTPDLLPDDEDDDSLGDSDMRTFEGAARTPSPSPLLQPQPQPAAAGDAAATATATTSITPLSLPKGNTPTTTPLIATHEHVNTGLYAANPSANASPASAEPFWILNRHMAPGRRSVSSRKSSSHRKSGVTFRDRSVLRVAASLCDESSPADSEIASEAKLQRKVKSDCCASPRSMHFATMPAAAGQPQPKNCDLHDTDYVDLGQMEFEEDLSSLTSEEEDEEETGAGCGSPHIVVGGPSSRSLARSVDGGSDGEVEMSYEGDGNGNDRRPMVSSDSNGGGSEAGLCASMSTAGGGGGSESAAPNNNSSSSLLLMSTSMPTPPSTLAKKGAQWTSFRATPRPRSSARTSPGLERIYRPRTPGPPNSTSSTSSTNPGVAGPLSAPSSASSMDTSEMPLHGGPHAPLLMSPSMWTFVRHGKRKLGMMGDSAGPGAGVGLPGQGLNERYEPYATSAAKRRAVSPIAYLASVSASSSSGVAGGNVAAVGVQSPLATQHYGGAGTVVSAASSPLTGSSGLANGLPTPTPLSMPSPTNPLLQPFWAGSSSVGSNGAGAGAAHHYHHNHHHRTLSGPYGRSASAFATAAAASSSRSGSPATRPSTPTNLNGTGAGASGQTQSSSATPGSAPPTLPLSLREIHHHHQYYNHHPTSAAVLSSPSLLATQTPGSAGSGPGYGSMPAALGLSLGGNSAARTRDAEEEEGNRGGMDEGVRMLGLS
ncbi:hypothetical protein CF327_g816 [Tilletia walkeri]|nr:hypothetical protein CF327_g816 [Tilletia walkeri]